MMFSKFINFFVRSRVGVVPELLFDITGQNVHNLKQAMYSYKKRDKFRKDVILTKYESSKLTKLTLTLIKGNSSRFSKFDSVRNGELYSMASGSGYYHTEGKSYILPLNERFSVIRGNNSYTSGVTYYVMNRSNQRCEIINFSPEEREIVNNLFFFVIANEERIKTVRHDCMLEMVNME